MLNELKKSVWSVKQGLLNMPVPLHEWYKTGEN